MRESWHPSCLTVLRIWKWMSPPKMRFILHFCDTTARSDGPRRLNCKSDRSIYFNSCRATRTRSGERNVFGNFLRENGDVLLVTQYGVHLWVFCSDKKVAQLLVWMLLQRFCTVPRKTSCVLHGDTVLYRIASRRFVEKLKYFNFFLRNGFCEGLWRLTTSQIRRRPSHRKKNEVEIGNLDVPNRTCPPALVVTPICALRLRNPDRRKSLWLTLGTGRWRSC